MWRLWNNDPRQYVRHDSPDDPAGANRQDYPNQAHDRGIDIEILSKASAYTCDPGIHCGTHQPLVRSARILTRAAVRTIRGIFSNFSFALCACHFASLRSIGLSSHRNLSHSYPSCQMPLCTVATVLLLMHFLRPLCSLCTLCCSSSDRNSSGVPEEILLVQRTRRTQSSQRNRDCPQGPTYGESSNS